MTASKTQQLPRRAPDGSAWREDALHALGAGMIAWPDEDAGPIIAPEIPLARYADKVEEIDGDLLRAERNRRLAESDWTQLADVTMPKAKAEAWKAYRKALRDLPATAKSLATVKWPSLPGK